MYKDKTFERIMSDMLDTVPDDIDKREGSIIYNALAPAAIELKKMYIQLDVIMNETFIDTASRKYLIKRAYERGIIPFPAKKAVLKGVFNMDVPIGSRFSLESLDYVVLEKIAGDGHNYKMECETAGEVGNSQLGRLIPIEFIQGLTTAKLTEILIPGEEEEDTAAIRERYLDSLSTEAFGGNQEDYRQKVNRIQGVGGVRVYPAWNGGGTVKLEIIDSNYGVPSGTLINTVQTAIDPSQNAGKGMGIAPIGHVVTVTAVAEETINIAFTIQYEQDWDFEAIKSYIFEAIDDYFLELKKIWEDATNLIIRISQLETRVLDINGVLDITGTTINGKASNHVVNGIPKRGAVSG
jgi:uncharacterized phage protein gp47/JayE